MPNVGMLSWSRTVSEVPMRLSGNYSLENYRSVSGGQENFAEPSEDIHFLDSIGPMIYTV